VEGKEQPTKTRKIGSIPWHLLKTGKIYLLPVYYVAMLSRVGREFVFNQGSAELQDLVYRNQAEGRFIIGRIFDRYLLNFPTARGMRSRLVVTQETVRQLIKASSIKDLTILDLACGYGRGLIGALEGIKDRNVRAYGLDLDEKAVEVATVRARERGMDNVSFHLGNALNPKDYPVQSADIVVMTGFAQYLAYEERMNLYRDIYSFLAEGGYLLTEYFCDWAKNRVQRWWKRTMEEFLGVILEWLDKEEVEEMFSQLPFRDVTTWHDPEKLYLMILARK